MSETEYAVDRTGWPEGPWMGEPDRVEWTTEAGLPAIALRQERGHWCGYAAVPPGHPAHGKDYDDVNVDIHGSLTYANECVGYVCHVPKPGEPDDVYWFGFDCAHGADWAPGGDYAVWHNIGRSEWATLPGSSMFGGTYKSLEYVKSQCESLAKQLKEMAS